MAATTYLRLPRRGGTARHRCAIGVAVMLVGSTVGLWPALIALPSFGGPFFALAIAVSGWTLARALAPPPHANDNAPRSMGRACNNAAGRTMEIETGVPRDKHIAFHLAGPAFTSESPPPLVDAIDAAG